MKHIRTVISLVIGLVLVFCLAARDVQADTHYVSLGGHAISPYTNWYDAATNIHPQATAQASAGDTIVVSNGVYTVFPSGYGIDVRKALTITSLYGAASTILDGGYMTNRGIFVYAAVTTTVYGLTITNWNGNGVRLEWPDGALVLVNCIISGNKAAPNDNGGGIYVKPGSKVWATNCIISGNVVETSNRDGGGVNFDGGTCVLNHCQITDNSSGYAGGVHAGGAGLTMQNCEIRGNKAYNGPGGVELAAGSLIENCTIASNETTMGPGGMKITGASTIRSSLVACNVATGYVVGVGYGTVGGVYIDGGTMINCTVVSNFGGNYDAGGFGGVNGTSINSIVYFNKSYWYPAYSNHMGATCSHAWTNSCTSPLPPKGSGNTIADPMLVNMPADCRLVRGSPCINRGLNQDWMTTAVDMDGTARIFNATVDIGAYEYWQPRGTIITILGSLAP